MAKFKVDTHLFRELGEYLVGRDSTALVELIKNSYDADATIVTVHGHGLENPGSARIQVIDDGHGMTPSVFENGFLTIASRTKEQGDKRSPVYKRRMTGAKGVGRLAAHKLAYKLDVVSIPSAKVYGRGARGVEAEIDWKTIESLSSLDEIDASGAVVQGAIDCKPNAKSGTQIDLSRLRRKWNARERASFFEEIHSFLPPPALTESPSRAIVGRPLFEQPIVRDNSSKDPGFTVELVGDFAVGEELSNAVRESADWIIDVNAQATGVSVGLLPTRKTKSEYTDAARKVYKFSFPDGSDGPYFQARILCRSGQGEKTSWPRHASGIRIYLEGFRVLPYAGPGDDWLDLDSDYRSRSRALRFLPQIPELSDSSFGDKDIGLTFTPSTGYFGAVFLTIKGSEDLKMLVNREGFLPNPALDNLKKIVRTAIDLMVRERAAYTEERRSQRRIDRLDSAISKSTPKSVQIKHHIEANLESARRDLTKLSERAGSGDAVGLQPLVQRAYTAISNAVESTGYLLGEAHITKILAALGMQMAAFVHDVKGLLVLTRQIEGLAERLRKSGKLSGEAKTLAIQVDTRVQDLKRAIERQAQYLSDVTSVDARRRRSRLFVHDRFESACRLYQPELSRQSIAVLNRIPQKLQTPVPMFSAELMLVFSNLLSNAVKFAGRDGRILATGEEESDQVSIKIENTGRSVSLRESERWFRPFESTTATPDPYLGQGMGLGLPIARDLLEDYGATMKFVRPTGRFATAVQILLPRR